MAGRGGPHFLGHSHSEASKAQTSAALKGRVFSLETKAKISVALKGRKHSVEHRRNSSLSRVGKKLSEEHKAKVGNFFRGKALSVEHRIKIGRGNALAVKEGRSKVGTRGISGYFYSEKNGKILHHRSLLELHWYQLLENMSKVKRYSVEPVMIPYDWEGCAHYYVPDLRIRYTDGTTELVEIKPENEWKDSRNLAKWKAAREWCKNRRVPTVFKVVGFEGLN